MKQLVIGILAHVDSGKTTLSEGLLYEAGEIRKLGRVDHKDAFLDSHTLEKDRGITIFSKQAVLNLPKAKITLLDTPGHIDFSTEMERALQVLDYAILVISGTDGVQSHTRTLLKLLTEYQVPTFIFVNKMDLAGADKQLILSQLKQQFHPSCIEFAPGLSKQDWQESLALCDEALMEEFLEKGEILQENIIKSIWQRTIFPCCFGSALKLQGVSYFLDVLQEYTTMPSVQKEFAAQVFKISQDEQGNRLTHLKITGGILQVKDLLQGKEANGQPWAEKINQIRVYSGAKYQTVQQALPGMVCAVTGLSKTMPGNGLGLQKPAALPVLQPILNYKIELLDNQQISDILAKLRQLEEEEPQLHIVWNEQLQEIHVQLMGEVQLEILKSLMQTRFGISIGFGPGAIVYKETITQPIEGVGHFEPLRHYAEVHLLLEPASPGSGLLFDNRCSLEDLDINWQNLVMTHLAEKNHLGVLTGSPITDIKITLLTGKGHQKHTEGGDFRQATYRAVRQGLKSTQSVLLEPWYDFYLEVPLSNVGRAMADLQRMCAQFTAPQTQAETAVLTGSVPVSEIQQYQLELAGYTQGRGHLTCTLKGYQPCHNQQQVIEALAYNSENDLDNTADSVFCSHGAGFTVKWHEVENYMHIPKRYTPKKIQQAPQQKITKVVSYGGTLEEDEELLEIFQRTYGPVKRDLYTAFQPAKKELDAQGWTLEDNTEYLLVDGYNIIFAWEHLNKIAKENIDAARWQLIQTLCNYKGFRPCQLILVFDAYKVKGNAGTVETAGNIHVVYTKEAETADMYIEKVTHKLAKNYRVRVATSDSLEQMIILGHGAMRISAKAFLEEIKQTEKEIQELLQ